MARYAAAIDQGTTGTRFLVFDRAGQVVAATYEEHTQITPRPARTPSARRWRPSATRRATYWAWRWCA